MPELPEVETTRRGIARWIVDSRVSRLVVREPRLRWPVDPRLATAIRGETVTAVDRRAKYLILRMSTIGDVVVHLGMSGRLRVFRELPAPAKHDHVDWLFDSGVAMRLTDPRRFGAVLWAPDGAERHLRLRDLGVEPLQSQFTGDYLFAQARRRQVPIKQFVMDAAIVVGVGNIYANEALFRAGIRPTVAARRVGRARMAALVAEIRATLQEAIEVGGTTLRDFFGSDGQAGYFALQLKVYGRGGGPCTRCARPLKEVRLGGRSTVYCPACQR